MNNSSLEVLQFIFSKKATKIEEIFTIDLTIKSIMYVRRPKMKRDAGVNAVFFLSKKTAFTPASLFIFGRPTDNMALVSNTFPRFQSLGEQNFPY